MYEHEIIKTALLHYYRFKRNSIIVGTEVDCDSGISDVLVGMDEDIIDVEVKTSIQDLKRDFTKYKHKKPNHTRQANKFYFCIPIDLYEKAIEIIKEYPCYGILVYDNSWRKLFDRIITKKRAKYLNKNTGSINFFRRKIIQRMGSELCNLKEKYIKLQENIND